MTCFRPASAALLPALALLLAACSGGGDAASGASSPDNGAVAAGGHPATIPLVISEGGRAHRFDVEVALTEKEQEKGLMFRKELAGDGGMIFPMDPPRIASFWMKDTVIPLDMLFVRTDGSVALVAPDVQPYSREPVSAGIPVAGVIELRGGRAAELGITEGAKVRWGNCAAPQRPDEAWDRLNFCPAE